MPEKFYRGNKERDNKRNIKLYDITPIGSKEKEEMEIGNEKKRKRMKRVIGGEEKDKYMDKWDKLGRRGKRSVRKVGNKKNRRRGRER